MIVANGSIFPNARCAVSDTCPTLEGQHDEALLAQHHPIGKTQPVDLALGAASPGPEASDSHRKRLGLRTVRDACEGVGVNRGKPAKAEAHRGCPHPER